jgi:hypothetical protein
MKQNPMKKRIKADLHTHLRTSSRIRQGDFNRLVDVASQRFGQGDGGIVGVVNFNDRRYEHLIGLEGYERDYFGSNKNGVYVPSKDILIVKGQEIPTKQGHLLVLGLGYDQHVRGDLSLEDTIKSVREINPDISIIGVHTHFRKGLGQYLEDNEKVLIDFDAIEINNGEAVYGNKQAREFYEMARRFYPFLGCVSTSDGHSFSELGTNWTELDRPDLRNGAVRSLRMSIKATNPYTPRQENVSYRGAVSHAVKLGLITKVAPVFGLGSFFKMERP